MSRIHLGALALAALFTAGVAEAQPRPMIRMPANRPAIGAQAGQMMPQVTPQSGPAHANTVGAEGRAEQIMDSRVTALEQQVAQLTSALQASQAALQAEQQARQALQTRYEGHTHAYTDNTVYWDNYYRDGAWVNTRIHSNTHTNETTGTPR